MGENNHVLTARDERFIAREIEEYRKELITGFGTRLKRYGDPVPAKDIEEVLKLIEHMLKSEKIENKKYTPKKYRK